MKDPARRCLSLVFISICPIIMSMFQDNMVLLLRRSIRTGWRQVWQGTTATGVAALTGSVLLIQLVLVLMLSVLWVEQLLIAKSVIHLELLPTATTQNVQELLSAAEHLPYITDATYVTREQAYEQEQARSSELTSFLEAYALQNPFSDRIDIRLASPAYEQTFYGFLRSEQWQSVIDPAFVTTMGERSEQVTRSLQLAWIARWIAAGFLGVSCIVLLLLMLDMQKKRLVLQRNAIIVGKLAGASRRALAMPFAAEFGLLLLLSLGLSMLILSGLTASATFLLQDAASSVGQLFAHLRLSLPGILSLELFAVPLLAFAMATMGLKIHREVVEVRLWEASSFTLSPIHSHIFEVIVIRTVDIAEAARFCILLTRERGR